MICLIHWCWWWSTKRSEPSIISFKQRLWSSKYECNWSRSGWMNGCIVFCSCLFPHFKKSKNNNNYKHASCKRSPSLQMDGKMDASPANSMACQSTTQMATTQNVPCSAQQLASWADKRFLPKQQDYLGVSPPFLRLCSFIRSLVRFEMVSKIDRD